MQNNQKKELILLKDLGYLYPTETSKRKARYGLYKCHCGNEFEVIIQSVTSEKTTSCGCLKIKHNLRNHRLYDTWKNMSQRCNNPKRKDYKNYGGRGISVCKEWHNIETFINDMYPTFVEGLTLDRIDTNGNYSKDNCRWTSREIQNRNTRKLKSTNTSGYRGVYWHKRDNKWVAQIRVNKKCINLGVCNTAIDAAIVRDKYIVDNNLEHTLNF